MAKAKKKVRKEVRLEVRQEVRQGSTTRSMLTRAGERKLARFQPGGWTEEPCRGVKARLEAQEMVRAMSFEADRTTYKIDGLQFHPFVPARPSLLGPHGEGGCHIAALGYLFGESVKTMEAAKHLFVSPKALKRLVPHGYRLTQRTDLRKKPNYYGALLSCKGCCFIVRASSISTL